MPRTIPVPTHAFTFSHPYTLFIEDKINNNKHKAESNPFKQMSHEIINLFVQQVSYDIKHKNCKRWDEHVQYCYGVSGCFFSTNFKYFLTCIELEAKIKSTRE